MSLKDINTKLTSKLLQGMNSKLEKEKSKARAKRYMSDTEGEEAVKRVNIYRNIVVSAFPELKVTDNLLSLKYIRKTQKLWSCHLCKGVIDIGSDAFRSFTLFRQRYVKLYTCPLCLLKLEEQLIHLSSEAIHKNSDQ